ncbi:NADH dehydrogenase [ubiquinone] 1 alpha subcomplex assembly factor 5 [Paragonimus westermani]|uniref:Arginine-hydroxylase NDUFAF5, mitochondrial n=1 Tax=Paragonimus westermani TaxID=34504 RepID=A0A5J4NMS1_9TREM|nr:NADH dehydrogenase [ubiquinone] 1 alpha subcomplex assembly factor 5 [Paragonimus westermani]
MHVFDRKTKIAQRNRSVFLQNPSTYDYVRDEVASRLADRICDISRKFCVAVDLGCGRGHLSKYLTSDSVDFLYQCDSAVEVLKQAPHLVDIITSKLNSSEEFLPLRENSVDLVLSCLSLHWVNDIPGIFRQVLSVLKNDGCFLGVMSASDTLFELRVALQLAEVERIGGFYPHISPFVDNVDVGELLYRVGFNLITLDVEELVVHYPNMFCLMDDLRGMGESNAALNRPIHVHRDVLLAASAIYDGDTSPRQRCTEGSTPSSVGSTYDTVPVFVKDYKS